MMRENSLTSLVIGVSIKILLVLTVVNILGCKYTGMSFLEMSENGGVLECVQQKSEEAINNVFDQLMSRM